MNPSPFEPKHTNRLIKEKSPYLLQHAHNPVDWYAWGEEAFERSKVENKPLFLSIGYSTCHWCHVMERESFENEAIAKLLNEHFVPVKVDREERPDVDQIYMGAVMALTGQGGWPLNVFLTPDLKPFYGGTYFAPDARYGRPGFPSILEDVARAWKSQPGEVEKAGKNLADFVAQSAAPKDVPPTELSQKVLDDTRHAYETSFDEKDGGFGGAPKFPRSMTLGFLLRLYWKMKDKALLVPVTVTLDKMAQGGIYDQVGGGFARYSTDDEWLVPHFEKMLYDNALLAKAYLEGFQATGNPEHARIAREIFTYLFRDMTHPEGGFFSAEDADSEGEEGKFYIWKLQELDGVLGKEDGTLFSQLYGATEKGNFEGANILHLKTSLPKALKEIGKDGAWWKAGQEKLLEARSKRLRPHLDDKVLTAWNSLMISALALGHRVLGDEAYLKAAQRADQFLKKNLQKNGRLLVSWRQEPSPVEGFIDDYAFFQQAQIDLYESTFELSYLKEALRLGDEMVRLFWDEGQGGFFFTGSDQRDGHRLLARQKEAYDGALPSGNSVAALNFYRLAALTASRDLRDRADAILKCFSTLLTRAGSNFPQMLQAFQFNLDGSTEVLVVGPKEASASAIRELRKNFAPHQVSAYSEKLPSGEMVKLMPWVEGRDSRDGKATFYVCRNYQCQLPTTDLRKALEEISTVR